MSENFSWSASVGRWMGIPVRFHLLLILFIVTILGFDVSRDNPDVVGLTAVVTTLVLLASVFLHELAHVFAVNSLGGHVSTLVLMPWGGNSRMVLPRAPRDRAIVYLAGPFLNGVIFLFGTALLVQTEHSTFAELVDIVHPHLFDQKDWWVSLVAIVTWVNFQLTLVNLIPCFPFDGAGAVRSLIASMNVDLPKVRAESAIKLIGNAAAFGIIGISWLVRESTSGPVQPWVLFWLIGVTLLFCANYSMHVETQEEDADWDDVEDMDYDSVYNDSSFFDFSNETENTAYSQWLQEKQEARRETELRKEQEEDRRADEILKKLHRGGIMSLNDDERSILDRVSARIRRRRQTGVSFNDQ